MGCIVPHCETHSARAGESKVAMTGAIATFKDLGYTIGPLMAGLLMVFLSIQSTLFVTGTAFVLLVPVGLLLHD